MQRIQRDVDSEALNLDDDNGNPDAVQGQTDYLNYRRDNDPARPMLKSLYGEEWTEKLIGEILFRDIQ
jgi:phycoerythrobilin:ferredoxin oxidoreductase